MAVVAALVGLVTACSPVDIGLGGARVAEGELRYWPGGACEDVAAIAVELVIDHSDGADETLDVWRLERERGVEVPVGVLTVGDVPAGFVPTGPLEHSWRDGDYVRVTFYGDTHRTGDLVWFEDLAASDDHPGEWYVNGGGNVDGLDPEGGWYTMDEIREAEDSDQNLDMYRSDDDVHSNCPEQLSNVDR